MSDNQVRVLNGRSQKDTATLLLAAVEEKGLDPHVIQVSTLGGFTAPESVAKAAGVDYEDPLLADGSRFTEDEVADAEKEGLRAIGSDRKVSASEDEEEPEQKKAPAKKTTSKKTEKGA